MGDLGSVLLLEPTVGCKSICREVPPTVLQVCSQQRIPAMALDPLIYVFQVILALSSNFGGVYHLLSSLQSLTK